MGSGDAHVVGRKPHGGEGSQCQTVPANASSTAPPS
jgi:hypothetical protein